LVPIGRLEWDGSADQCILPICEYETSQVGKLCVNIGKFKLNSRVN
jgi:hypothetical protein